MPPKFLSGEVLSAAKLNEVVDSIIQKIMGGRGISIKKFGSQVIIEAKEELYPSLPPLRQMVVKIDEGDYLTCRSLDACDVEGSQDINVLKPWTLRKSPFDGKTINGITYVYSQNYQRTATTNDYEEIQYITSEYWVDCVIYAAKMSIGVEVETDEYASWIDVNVDGRAWGVESWVEGSGGGGPQE